ncbi:MAG TPA: phytanoyl-CoA dioxygenase family protein [Candidatus Xenobia bacterium]|jgi:ectoine hydroxylase-related dioxygenase (phytanoyl-CoA dioxygenase family)
MTNSLVAQYRTDGYAIYDRPVFAPSRFRHLLETFEELLERYGAADLDTIHFREERLLDFLLDDRVLDLVEPLVGPDIGLWSSHFICKLPGDGKATPWHEDSAYWEGRVSTMEGICTLWLALDQTAPDNGCMRVIPGSHEGGSSDYVPVDASNNIFDREIEHVDESRQRFLSLLPNQCSFHEARIIHGALANTSPRRRAGYTMRYFPTSSKIYPERNPGHRIWLARGRDRAGNLYEN